jgi:uncharacterized membrane protein YphA (DoxX/SURF4 family)
LRLKKIILSPWLNYLIRFILGCVFLYAGVTKLFDPKAFAKIISHYDLVPEGLLAPVAIGLPVLEVLAGVGLFFAVRGSLSVVFGLLLMFVFVLWYGILKNMNIDCGCFSPQELNNYAGLQQALYRDIGMIVAVVFLYVSHWVSGSKTRFSQGTKIKNKLKEVLRNA